MDRLIEYAKTYENYYKQKINGIFHTACGCVVGQQVTFNVGRNIRKNLYELYGFPLNRELILNADLSQIKNLSDNRILLLKQMAKIDDNRNHADVLNDYSNLKYFGKWTFGAVSILMDLDDNINLASDTYIRKNLALYTNQSKMSEKEAFDYISKAEYEQTRICYLLWRIKPSSISKINNNVELTVNDFV